jgi:hypothetical protein
MSKEMSAEGAEQIRPQRTSAGPPGLRAMDFAFHVLTDVAINCRSFGPGPRHLCQVC